MSDVRIAELWRYPVKSLRGEPLEQAQRTHDGVAGDRLVHVSGRRDPLTGRTRHALLTVPATTGPDGVPWVAGHRWDSAEATEVIRRQGGDDARLVADDSPARFDILNLLVATDGAIERFGYDSRRLRPNIVLSGVPADVEPGLPGQALSVGEALIGVYSVRQRCIVTTVDPDTGSLDLEVFRRIRTVFGGELALNCWVIQPGVVRVGNEVRVVASDATPADVGGWIVGSPYRVHANPG